MNWIESLLRRFLKKCGLRLMRARNCPQGTEACLYSDIAARLAREGQPFLLLDVGANCGAFAKSFLMNLPQARVHAFEPSPEVFQELVRAHQGDPRVACHHQGISATSGSLAFEVRPDDPTLGRIVSEAGPGNIAVDVTTMDAFLDNLGWPMVGLLKTDTEGHETKVLRGAEKSFRDRRILSILVEVTLGNGTDRHVALQEVADMLRPHDFVLHGVYDLGYDRHHGGLRFCNALFKLRNEIPAGTIGSIT